MLTMRAAFRQLTRNTAFSVAVVLTLALGLGSSVLIYSVIRAVLLESLPYDEPDRIVRLDELDADGNRPRLADPNFFDLKQQSRSFSALAQFARETRSVSGGSEPVRANVAAASSEFLAVMRVQPAIGRAFAADEAVLGGSPAAIVSHDFWQRNLGGAAAFASQALTIDDRVHTVVGVMPPGFDYPERTDVWVPRELWPVSPSRTGHNYESIGRLAPGTTLAAARAELNGLAAILKAQHGEATQMVGVRLVTLHEHLVGDVRPALLVMLAAVALVFLVSCSNVAGMLLVRVVNRSQELGVRLALGAGRGGLAKLFVAEALVLCVLGSVLGVVLASVSLDLLRLLEAGGLPRTGGLRIEGTAVLLAGAMAACVAVGLGLVVAAAGIKGDLARGAPRAIGGGSRSHIRDGLVSAQVAMAFVLLAGTALLGRSFLSVAAVDPGYRVDGVVLMNLALTRPADQEGRARLAAFYDELLARLRALPGVDTVGGISSPPLAGNGTNGAFVTVGRPDEIRDFEALRGAYADPSRRGFAEFRLASDGYFTAMGIPLVQGRAFDERDSAGPLHSAVISRALAESQWPGENPLGKLIQFGGMDGDLTALTVIGVVGDVFDYGVDSVPRPTFYASYRQRQRHLASFWIAMKGPAPEALIPAARSIVRNLDPDVPPEFRMAEELYGDTLAHRKLNLAILGVFGGSALFLSLVSIYGAVAFAVTRRTREIGLRIALGAPAGRIVVAMVSRTLVVVGTGLAIGAVIAVAGARVLGAMLYGITLYDPATYLLAAFTLVLGAALMSWWPAQRATRIEPTTALREQ
jgi:predicted permease